MAVAREPLAELAARSSTPSSVIEAEPDGTLRIIAANDAAGELGGAGSGAALEGRTIAEVSPRSIAPLRDALARGARTTVPGVVLEGGRVFDVELIPLSPTRIGLSMHETTREQRARHALELTTRELQDLYDRAPIGYHSIDRHGVFRRINDTELRWLGYTRDEIVGVRRFVDLLTPESREQFERTFDRFIERGETSNLQFDMVRKDGSLLPVLLHATAVYDASGAFVASRSTVLDVTERRRAEEREREVWTQIEHHLELGTEELRAANEGLRAEIAAREQAQAALAQTEVQLRQALKMEAVGRLAGGVAHDFNNMLSVILIFTELALGEMAVDDARRGDLEQVRGAAVRATELTRQLLAFSRQQVLDARPILVDDVIAGLERLLQRLIGEQVGLSTTLGARGTRILADVGQIEQVIVNLAVNARDAMPRGGRLRIETGVVDLDDDYAASHHGVRAGRYVVIAVSDTGVGMSKETLDRAFEPFFTTKEPGKGTGLGLSTVYGIVAQSGGHVWAYSEVGLGTTIKVYLPVVEHDSGAGDARSGLAHARGGSETILLVEDDPLVRAAARRILARSGYLVVEASAPAEALSLASGLARVDALLTDVVMPELTGPELADRLRVSRPDLPVVYMSGYLDVDVVGPRVLEERARFVQKPLTNEALLRAVRDAIDRR
ncbi:sensory box histidine kinase/response regulator [Sandaracinus amylolyticus]|uniref:histidine kinase n=1 Tax=Sandaracinus amylolyticus TaxID=927083 RepID=A0A0F6YF19_9BACT|nr:sensory box histidine kinase/response regulator [Sandaracinus amylolyticus]